MKKLLVTTAIALSVSCTAAINGFAASNVQVVDNWNGIVAVSGTATPGSYVSLTVLNPDSGEADFASAPQASVQYYEGTVAKDAFDCTCGSANAVNYCFHFKIEGDSGDYTIITNADGAKDIQTLPFSSVGAKQKSIQDINGFAEESNMDVKTAELDNAMTNFAVINNALYVGNDKSAVVKALENLTPEDGFAWDNAEALNAMEKVLKEACLIAAYNTDNVDIVSKDGSLLYLEDMMSLSDTDELGDYNGILDNGTEDTSDDLTVLADKDLVMQDMFNDTYKTVAEIEEAFKESVRFRVLVDYNARGYGHVEEYFEKYEGYYTEVGFDFDEFSGISRKSDIYSEVAASSADDIYELKDEFNDLLDDNDKSSGSKKPSGGGGGGGISYGGGYVPNNSADKAEEEKEEVKEEVKEPAATPEPSAPVVETVGGFADVPATHWAAEPIKALAEEGILSGRGDGKFDINGTITRAELTKIVVVSVLGAADEAAENPFADSSEHWAKSFIATAVKAGITNGVTDTQFNPDGLITREQAAAILYRAITAKGIALENKGEAFADDASINDWAKDAVYALKAAGIISGRDGDNFCPGDSLTRAEAAKLVYLLRNLK